MADALSSLVVDYLGRRPGELLAVAEIARALVEEHPERFRKKEEGLGGRPALITQLTREIYGRRAALLRQYPQVATDESRSPLRLFVEGAEEPSRQSAPAKGPRTTRPDLLEGQAEEQRREHDLYRPLQEFLRDSQGTVSKRIRESTSKNRRGQNGNRWLHPDIVGMIAPGQDWEDLVRQCSNAMPITRAKLVALEVKVELTRASLRESFFQAVSNSLWANRAYLAATRVKGADTLAELTMLSSLHGVGFISIDSDNPAESRVVIPAREREEVDWASANRIAAENADFRVFLQQVLNYLQTGQLVEKLWDI